MSKVITFEQVHHKPIAQRAALVLGLDSAEGFWIKEIPRQIAILDRCLKEMRENWDGKEHTLVETFPGYPVPWLYEDQMEGEEMTLCGVCGYVVVEDEHWMCEDCEVRMCLYYCHQAASCPERAGENVDNAPDKIYFQVDPDWTPESGHHPFQNATWSVEPIEPTDILYIRAIDPPVLRTTLPPSDTDNRTLFES